MGWKIKDAIKDYQNYVFRFYYKGDLLADRSFL